MHQLLNVLLTMVIGIDSAKVLFMPNILYPMHSYTMKYLADELLHRNHQVTWLEYGPYQTKTSLAKGIRRIFWPVQFGNQIFNDIFVHRNHSTHYQIWDAEFELTNERTTAWLASIRLCDRLLMRSKAKFDEMLHEQYGSVYIYWSMTALRTESAWANQSPSPPSYLPVHGTKLTDDLSFTERTYNLVSYFRSLYNHQVIVLPRIDEIFQKYYSGVAAAFDIERNASINFVNNPPIFDFARPFMPRVNFVGGLHCRNATELGGALRDFVAAASEEDGFVLISTGFTAQWALAPQRIKDIYLSAFRAYPKTRFIWQYNGVPFENNLPLNVFVQSWMPQQDLLGHPKCRVHISHGGMNSVIESVWHGVPVIGVPLTVSGHDNLLRVTARGAGILIPKTDSVKKN
ncbi:UDP-glucoronosyl and UDP-glucosyl transferase [Dictyocaulus viviparus]|uniref:glucuronosyltransferase n=1 Tax=Dictyocaulus viviparus TaxID=29172 RepID=A0A0D8Y7U7_DICVI|nr:UDP-glucoronosyl and UDP-glucosyl transferase [Dictyocaulus viviparus]